VMHLGIYDMIPISFLTVTNTTKEQRNFWLYCLSQFGNGEQNNIL